MQNGVFVGAFGNFKPTIQDMASLARSHKAKPPKLLPTAGKFFDADCSAAKHSIQQPRHIRQKYNYSDATKPTSDNRLQHLSKHIMFTFIIS